EVHPGLEAVTMRSLERDPQKRYATAAIFADELEKAARSIHALASVREVAEYVQKVLGQEIAQQREVVRAWLAQSEPSRTERDDLSVAIWGDHVAPAPATESAQAAPPVPTPPPAPAANPTVAAPAPPPAESAPPAAPPFRPGAKTGGQPPPAPAWAPRRRAP